MKVSRGEGELGMDRKLGGGGEGVKKTRGEKQLNDFERSLWKS